jgi:hypothetical protein
MDLSFRGVSSADAGYLAQELELALLRAGAPGDGLSLKRASSENMDLGTVLGVSVDAVLHAIGAAGYIACFVKCIHEVVTKHNVTIRIVTPEGAVEISASQADAETIAKAIASPRKVKSKAKTKT